MDSFSSFILALLAAGIFFYALYGVIRGAVKSALLDVEQLKKEEDSGE